MNPLKPNDLKPVYELLSDVVWDTETELQAGTIRQQKALEQMIEAQRLLFVACVNLDLVQIKN